MRKIFAVLVMLFPFFLNAQTDVNSLVQQGKLSQAWEYLQAEINSGNLSFENLEMWGNVTFEISEGKGSKKNILELIEQVVPVLKENAFLQGFTAIQQARIFHKYNTLIAKKAQIQGPSAAIDYVILNLGKGRWIRVEAMDSEKIPVVEGERGFKVTGYY